MKDKNLGTLERWFAIHISRIKAAIYAMFHRGCRVYIESRFIEVRPHETPHVDWVYLDSDGYFKEEITFVGVVRGSRADETFQIERWYYGNSRFDNVTEESL